MKAMSRAMTAVAAIGLLSTSLTACSGKDDTSSSGSTPAPTQNTATQTPDSTNAPGKKDKAAAGAAGGMLDAKSADELEEALSMIIFDGMLMDIPYDSKELTTQARDLVGAMSATELKITPEECSNSFNSNLSEKAVEDLDFMVGGTLVDTDRDKVVAVTISRNKSNLVVKSLSDPALFSGKCDDMTISMGGTETSVHSEYTKLDLPHTQVAVMRVGSGIEGDSDSKTIIAADGKSVLQVFTSSDYSAEDLKALAVQVLDEVAK